MFKIGDTVLYSSEGVCKITDVTVKQFGDFSMEYFVLQPVFNNRSTFFVPTANEKLLSRMHPILNIDQLVETVSNAKEFDCWIDNDSQRREAFREIMSGGEISEIVSLTKTLMRHKDEIETTGKKLHKADESVFKDAQKILYEEFAMVADIEKDDIVNILNDEDAIFGIRNN